MKFLLFVFVVLLVPSLFPTPANAGERNLRSLTCNRVPGKGSVSFKQIELSYDTRSGDIAKLAFDGSPHLGQDRDPVLSKKVGNPGGTPVTFSATDGDPRDYLQVTGVIFNTSAPDAPQNQSGVSLLLNSVDYWDCSGARKGFTWYSCESK